MSKDVLHAPADCEGIADVKAPSYSVCPFLSIRDDKAARLIPSLMRQTRKNLVIREGEKKEKRIALIINQLLLRDSSGIAYSNSCRDTVFCW